MPSTLGKRSTGVGELVITPKAGKQQPAKKRAKTSKSSKSSKKSSKGTGKGKGNHSLGDLPDGVTAEQVRRVYAALTRYVHKYSTTKTCVVVESVAVNLSSEDRRALRRLQFEFPSRIPNLISQERKKAIGT